MKSNKIGAYTASTLVLVVAVGFYTYSKMLLSGVGYEPYALHTQFYSANSIEEGGDVILAGVPVGVIRSIHLNKDTFMADVQLNIDKNIQLPEDSQFSIGSVSMTDSGVVIINPGHSKEYLKPDSIVTNTQPYASIEQQISNYIFGSGKLTNE